MEKIKLQVSGSQIQVVQRPAAITAGTVGLEAEFSFDSHWDNLGKTAVFRAGDKVITAALEQDTHIVPWEVLEKPDLWLVVGVYGANAEGTVVIPTLWTKVAAVYTGVDPEGDPALEPSNPIWQETLARIATMGPQVQEHIDNTDNPHGVSCGQIGAVTQKEFRDVISNLDGSSDPGELIPHLLNRDNPHGVTAAQAGAAPAGYGLGEKNAAAFSWNQTPGENSFIRANTGSPDGEWWYGLNCKYYNYATSQIAFKVGASNDSNMLMAIRHRPIAGTSGAFSEWEYVNPPMVEGVEYRTTERFNGKPVYAKLVNVGILPNTAAKQVSLLEEAVNVVEVKGFLTRNSDGGYFPLPRLSYETASVDAYVYAAYASSSAATTVSIITTTDMSNYTACITVKYTKNAAA